MTPPSKTTLVAALCAAAMAALYVSPVLGDVLQKGLEWPIWLDHKEGVAMTSYGKWWVMAPHNFLSDGSSGEFPVFTYYLSDSLLNLIAELGGWPSITVQAVLYGPFLGFAFLLLNYLAISAVVRDRRVALWAGLLISLGGNASFVDRLDPVSGFPLNFMLHVPFQTLSLGTAQSLGWVLFLPCLSLTHLAYRHRSARRAVAAGTVLGLLFMTHTLTFVNVAVVQLLYLVLVNAFERPRDRRFWAWLVALGLVGAAFVSLVATHSRVSLASLVALAAVALAATFLVDPHKRYYLWSYGAAGLVAGPYLLVLARHARALATLPESWTVHSGVGLAGLALFFSAYGLGAALAYRYCQDRPVLIWTSAILGATALLAFNHVWRWDNHAYRFAIDLIFPLGILAALGVRHAPRPVGVLIGVWLSAVCLLNVGQFVTGHRTWVRFRVAEPERAAFFRAVRDTTAALEGTGARILGPAEVGYPRGVFQSAQLMSFSRIPAFVPDYRHVLWRERYHNRRGLFCFLFPDYPNEDTQFHRRGCDEKLDPEPELLEIRNPRLKSAILPLYSIELAAAPAKPFSNHLREAEARYGWPAVVDTDRTTLLRTTAAALPGVARLVEGRQAVGTLSLQLEVGSPGLHFLILGGRELGKRAPKISLDGRELDEGHRSPNWAVFARDLAAGPHRLELPSHDGGVEPESDYLYFVALIHERWHRDYVTLGPPVAMDGNDGARSEVPGQDEAETVGVHAPGHDQQDGSAG
jgi:hypothetical protein